MKCSGLSWIWNFSFALGMFWRGGLALSGLFHLCVVRRLRTARQVKQGTFGRWQSLCWSSISDIASKMGTYKGKRLF